jgi:small-conductance mechanosensitive channel
MLHLPWLDTVVLGHPVALWLLAAIVAGSTAGAIILAKAIFIRRLATRAAQSETRVDDAVLAVVRSLRGFVILLLAIGFATRTLELPVQAQTMVRTVLTIALAYQALVAANVVVDQWLLARFTRPGLPHDSGAGYGAVRFAARVTLWTAILLVALDNLGVEITTLVAGLGVGGIAVALAVQSILGDIFCSLSILFDKPFEIGDFIVVGDHAGSVEHIGVKTTRIRSLSGEQLVFANSDLVASRVRNYKRMSERRVLFEIGVTYDTTPEQAAEIPTVVREIIERLADTRFDRAHFKAFGDFALVFEVVYFVLVPGYNEYMDTQQMINLAILRAFAARNISFAYPTQTVYVQAVDEPRAAA